MGGHSGNTIVPLLSQTPGISSLSQSKVDALVERIRKGGDEVVSAKEGGGSATLSMAHAGFVFVENVIKALGGDKDVVMPAYTECDVVDGCSFFAVPCRFGKGGVEEVVGLGEISDGERGMIEDMKGALASQIEKGRAWAIDASANEDGQGKI